MRVELKHSTIVRIGLNFIKHSLMILIEIGYKLYRIGMKILKVLL